MNKYIRAGGKSFYENKGRYINPYESGSAEFNFFERGWSQALKRAPASLIRKYSATTRTPRFGDSTASRSVAPRREKKALADHVYTKLSNRARAKLLDSPSYQPPRFEWKTKVYYIRVETKQGPLWKIGVTCNNITSRYRVADRRVIARIRSWQYSTREEAGAIEREILEEFSDDLYVGNPVLRSGGDGELFTRDVLEIDAQDDFLARLMREN